MFGADRELDTLPVQRGHQLVVLKPDVAPDHDLALMAGATDAGEQLIDEPLNPALGVRLSFPQPDVQHLTGVERVASSG